MVALTRLYCCRVLGPESLFYDRPAIEIRLHYLHARQIAMRAERDTVKAAGISWGAYQSFMKKHEKSIEEEKFSRVPRDLDLTLLPR
jgi:hypothetical protein